MRMRTSTVVGLCILALGVVGSVVLIGVVSTDDGGERKTAKVREELVVTLRRDLHSARTGCAARVKNCEMDKQLDLKKCVAQRVSHQNELEVIAADAHSLERRVSELQAQLAATKKQLVAADAPVTLPAVEQPPCPAVPPAERQYKPFTSGERLVHLDLKGAPPRASYLIALMPLLRQLGATGLLIEWEDTLPFTGILEVVRSVEAYTTDEVAAILKAAHDNALTVIPLVQTFGHVEFLLKHESLASHRADPSQPAVLCACCNDTTLAVITTLIDQVLALHPSIEHIHLGADEAWQFDRALRCAQYMQDHTPEDLYVRHMRRVVDHVLAKGLRVLVWDDMLRQWSADNLKRMKGVEPVVWQYQRSVGAAVNRQLLTRYVESFGRVWIASAFKGATGPLQDMPPLDYHTDNHLSWLALLDGYEHRDAVAGVALTGWSRYDHYGALCELLGTSIPSLGVCLGVLRAGRMDSALLEHTHMTLGMSARLPLQQPQWYDDTLGVVGGSFPGTTVLTVVVRLERARQSLTKREHTVDAWCTRQLPSAFVNPLHLKPLMLTLDALKAEFSSLSAVVRSKWQSEVYHRETCDEWIDSHVRPQLERVDRLIAFVRRCLKFDRVQSSPSLSRYPPPL